MKKLLFVTLFVLLIGAGIFSYLWLSPPTPTAEIRGSSVQVADMPTPSMQTTARTNEASWTQPTIAKTLQHPIIQPKITSNLNSTFRPVRSVASTQQQPRRFAQATQNQNVLRVANAIVGNSNTQWQSPSNQPAVVRTGFQDSLSPTPSTRVAVSQQPAGPIRPSNNNFGSSQSTFKPANSTASDRFGLPDPNNRNTFQPPSNTTKPAVARRANYTPPERFGSGQLPAIATSVQTLVRAKYKLPIEAAKNLETLFAFDGNEKVETKTIELKHPKLTLLQVTTDAATQKAIAQFLNTIYSAERIEEIDAATTEADEAKETSERPEDSTKDKESTTKVSLKLPGMT